MDYDNIFFTFARLKKNSGLMKNAASLFVLLCWFVTAAIAQEQTNPKKKLTYNTWSVGIDAGKSISYTDIMDYDFFPKDFTYWGTNGSFFVNKQISPFFGLQAHLYKGSLYGIKGPKTFAASYFQYGVNSYFSITDLLFTNVRHKKVNFYFLVGAGLIRFRTYRKTGDEVVEAFGYSIPDLSQGRPTTEFVIPTAAGINVKLSRDFDLNAEIVLQNLVSSDKLDAQISGNSNDKYASGNIGISYKFGKKENHYLAWISSREKQEFEEKLAKKNKKLIDSLNNALIQVQNKLRVLDSISNALPQPEADDDGDGVPNSRDDEPNTPKGNMVNFRGVSIIKLKDTVKVEKTKVVLDTVIAKDRELLFSIYFDFNKSDIRQEDKLKIVEAVKKLKANPEYLMEIRGHADKTGSAQYNEQLSKKRSQAVVDMLTDEFGIDSQRLIRTYSGEDELLSSKDDAINRRVDFIIIKPHKK